jgi:hypothetical protein
MNWTYRLSAGLLVLLVGVAILGFFMGVEIWARSAMQCHRVDTVKVFGSFGVTILTAALIAFLVSSGDDE